MAISPDDPRLQKAGFARLVGRGIDYTLRKYECTMGRKSKAKNVDLELGDTMSISRKHACISYNFEKGFFEIAVYGKNGVSINGVTAEAGTQPIPLQSQSLIQVANDVAFYFLLPKSEYDLFPPSIDVGASVPRSHAQNAQAAPGRAGGVQLPDPPSEHPSTASPGNASGHTVASRPMDYSMHAGGNVPVHVMVPSGGDSPGFQLPAGLNQEQRDRLLQLLLQQGQELENREQLLVKIHQVLREELLRKGSKQIIIPFDDSNPQWMNLTRALQARLGYAVDART